ncbi:MAG: DUF58 domain-containing protein [Thalassobaculales bacterium]
MRPAAVGGAAPGAGSGGDSAGRAAAEHLAEALPPLMVAADRVAATVWQGVHGRRRVGQGESFWQFRRYSFGDPVRLIDWRQSAKSDRAYVRENEWEAAQSVWLWRDGSPSMDWASRRDLPSKRDRATLLALALGALLVNGGEQVAALGAAHPPRAGRHGFQRLAENLVAGAGAVPDAAAAALLPRHSHAVLFGDFLSPLAAIRPVMAAFAARSVKGMIVQVIDPAEQALPHAGRVRYEGLEGEAPMLVSRAETIRPDYNARMREHQDGLRAMAQAANWHFTIHHTDQPPHRALLALYLALAPDKAG